MFNAHRNQSYKRDCFDRVAKNNVVSKPWTPLKKSGEFLDVAGPWDQIMWISITRKTFAFNNETLVKWKIIYYPVNEDDTYLIWINSGVTDETMVWKFADIDSNCDLDVVTIWSWTQMEILQVMSNNVLEVSIIQWVWLPIIPPTIFTAVFNNGGTPLLLDNWQAWIFDVSIPWVLISNMNILNIYPLLPVIDNIIITWQIIEDWIVRITIENQSGEDDVSIPDINIKVQIA